MKFITLVAALAAAVPAALGLTINTPSSVVECEPTQFSWSGGTAPYYLTLVPAGQSAAPAIKQFPTLSDSSYTWTVDLQSGTSFTIALKDSTGSTAYSDIVTVQAGTSTTCVNTSVQETGSGGSGAAPTGGSGSSAAGTTAAAGSTAAAGTTAAKASAGSSSSATSTASGSTSSSTSAAGRLSVSSALGVAGIMGLVGAALF